MDALVAPPTAVAPNQVSESVRDEEMQMFMQAQRQVMGGQRG